MTSLRACVIACVLLIASQAHAAIVRDNQKDLGWNGSSTSTLTASYTMGAVSNGLLVVSVDGQGNGGADDCTGGGNGVTWNTTETMTFVREHNTGSFANYVYLFYLLNPTSGTHNIVITCGSVHQIIAEAVSYSGVGALDVSTDSESAATTAATFTLNTVAANAVVLMATGATTTGGLSAGAGTTQSIVDGFQVTALYESNPVSTGGGSVSLIENSVGSVIHAAVLASFTQAGGAAATPCQRTLLGVGCEQ